MEIPFAIYSNGEYLYANELTEKHREISRRQPNTYICPECGAYLTIGTKQTHYFSHKPNQSCALDTERFSIEYQNYILQREYNGRIEIQNNIGSCIYCNYKNIDLIQYIADMHHNGNKLKAAQKISQTLTIPYSDSKTT